MAVTGGLIISGVSAVASYSQQKKAASAARDSAERQRIADGNTAAANRQAAEQAVKKQQVASEAEANTKLATEQLDNTPDVTTGDANQLLQRRRAVQGQFDLGSGGVGASGALRV